MNRDIWFIIHVVIKVGYPAIDVRILVWTREPTNERTHGKRLAYAQNEFQVRASSFDHELLQEIVFHTNTEASSSRSATAAAVEPKTTFFQSLSSDHSLINLFNLDLLQTELRTSQLFWKMNFNRSGTQKSKSYGKSVIAISHNFVIWKS